MNSSNWDIWTSDNSGNSNWEYWISDSSSDSGDYTIKYNLRKKMKIVFDDGTEIWIDEEEIQEENGV